MSTTATPPVTHFELSKGNKFQINKGIKRLRVGLGWEASGMDPDASAFGLIHNSVTSKPKFYNGGSHAVCYANKGLERPDGTFTTEDGSISHSGDDRQGNNGNDAEVITTDLTKMPAAVQEVAYWVTIYDEDYFKANGKHITFANIKNIYLHITDPDNNNADICRYQLGDEFADSTAVQVGSLTKENDIWHFTAVGAGSMADLDAVIKQYQ